jgi:tetratricopeptide (TPR) repeat protein
MGQQGIALNLRVNQGNKAIIYQDEPLIISVSISNPGATYNAQWNREADQSLQQLKTMHQNGEVTVEQYDQEIKRIQQSKKKIQIPAIGTISQPAYQKVKVEWKNELGTRMNNISMKLLSSSSMPNVLVLDANAYYLLQWGINRKEVGKLKPGKYILMATLDNYHSEPVELEILTSAIPSSKLNTIAVQHKLGKFELLSGQAESAAIHAKNILKLNSASVDGLVLLGEVNVQKNNYKEALKNFEDALMLFNKQKLSSPEPPEYIFGMIEWLKGKIK